VHPGTRTIVNTAEFLPGDFTRNADFSLPGERLKRAITAAAGREHTHFIDATRLAVALTGNAIGANIFLLGYAWQLGAIPLSASSIEEAIELNGEAVAMNISAFRWGRRAAVDLDGVEALIAPQDAESGESDSRKISQTLDEAIARRAAFLTDYQDAAYAERYRTAVEKVRRVETATIPSETGLTEAIAKNLFKLMAYKDEYEVARLQSDSAFARRIRDQFAGEKLTLQFHLAPPLLARTDKTTGEPRKMAFGEWMLPVFRVLAKFKGLRGTALDIFGYTEERRTERRLIVEYEALLEELLAKLTPENHHMAVALANIPQKIRGFGHIKMRNLKAAKAEEAALLEQFRAGHAPLLKAAESFFRRYSASAPQVGAPQEDKTAALVAPQSALKSARGALSKDVR
jgi:indolepyruvate ferredoxin oxidoreductase